MTRDDLIVFFELLEEDYRAFGTLDPEWAADHLIEQGFHVTE